MRVPKISLIGRENVSRSGAPGCSPAAPGRGVATSFGRPPAANQVTGWGAGSDLPASRSGGHQDGAGAGRRHAASKRQRALEPG